MMHILARKKIYIPLLGWEQCQFQIVFCKFLPYWGTENFEKISVHKPCLFYTFEVVEKIFLHHAKKQNFFAKNWQFWRGGEGRGILGTQQCLMKILKI